MRIVVDGRPVPQGSMTASYNRKTQTAHVHHVQGAALALWRATVRQAAKSAGAELYPGPVTLSVTFGMPRPKSHLTLRRGQYVVKMQHYYDQPAVMPDLDKLVRGVSDALTGVCYRDDAQIVVINASKVYGDVSIIEVAPAYGPFEVPHTLRLGETEEGDTDTG
jgi:crossover junction endodeoxyribonuclease RusA